MSASDFIEVIKWGLGVLLGGGVVGVGLWRKAATAQTRDDAAARVEVAGASVEEKVYSGQRAELARLQKLVEQMSDDLRVLTRKVRDLEADVVVLESYFEAIILCDSCRDSNQKIIERTRKVFRKYAPQTETHPPAPDGGTVCPTTAALVGKEKYAQAAGVVPQTKGDQVP